MNTTRIQMEHKLWYNQVQGFAYMQLVGELSRGEIVSLFSHLEKVYQDASTRNLIIDLRLSPGMVPQKEIRDLFQKQASKIGLDQIAVLGADAATRMTFKILMAVLGKTSVTRFVSSERQALEWLKQGGRRE